MQHTASRCGEMQMARDILRLSCELSAGAARTLSLYLSYTTFLRTFQVKNPVLPEDFRKAIAGAAKTVKKKYKTPKDSVQGRRANTRFAPTAAPLWGGGLTARNRFRNAFPHPMTVPRSARGLPPSSSFFPPCTSIRLCIMGKPLPAGSSGSAARARFNHAFLPENQDAR